MDRNESGQDMNGREEKNSSKAKLRIRRSAAVQQVLLSIKRRELLLLWAGNHHKLHQCDPHCVRPNVFASKPLIGVQQ